MRKVLMFVLMSFGTLVQAQPDYAVGLAPAAPTTYGPRVFNAGEVWFTPQSQVPTGTTMELRVPASANPGCFYAWAQIVGDNGVSGIRSCSVVRDGADLVAGCSVDDLANPSILGYDGLAIVFHTLPRPELGPLPVNFHATHPADPNVKNNTVSGFVNFSQTERIFTNGFAGLRCNPDLGLHGWD